MFPASEPCGKSINSIENILVSKDWHGKIVIKRYYSEDITSFAMIGHLPVSLVLG